MIESPDPDETQTEPPLSGTVDDDDNVDDERWDENEAPTRAVRDTREGDDGFQLEKPEEDADEDLTTEDEEGLDSQ